MSEDVNREDRSLIEGCLKGKSFAQEKLFKKYYALMLAICLRYSDNKSEARDILQEGFVKIYGKLHLFKFEGSFIGWMKRIMVNTAIDKYRKNIQTPRSVELNDNLNAAEDESILSKLGHEDLLRIIQKLPKGYRTVFNMYVIEGYSHKEIATKLGISEGTSKSQLFKAKQQLQIFIKELYQ